MQVSLVPSNREIEIERVESDFHKTNLNSGSCTSPLSIARKSIDDQLTADSSGAFAPTFTLEQTVDDLKESLSNLSPLVNPDEIPLLLTDESFACCFLVKKPFGASYPTLGTPEVKWRSYMGESGYVRGLEIVPTKPVIPYNHYQIQSNHHNRPSTTSTFVTAAPSSDSKALRAVCLDAPSHVSLFSEFTVKLRIFNETGQKVQLQLQTRDNTNALAATGSSAADAGLCVSGVSCMTLGALDIADVMDTELSVFALNCGLQTLRSIVLVDLIQSWEYPGGALCRVLVQEPGGGWAP